MMAALAIEFLLLYVACPPLVVWTRNRIPPIPMLWAGMAYCLVILLRDPQFDPRRLWETKALWHSAPSILGLFAAVVAIGAVLTWRNSPNTFLDFPRSNPLLWGLVMVLYPVLSVYPQGIVYRLFLFERYGALFGSGWGMVIAGAMAFSYCHSVFRNPLALVLTFWPACSSLCATGQTGSLTISSVEHALYGCAVFTFGLGRWFYRGAVRMPHP
jgi:hypothetical protein